MQVKKFEAPTISEALKLVKAELGPEAIILSTKQNKKGFGLLSKASVELTAAITEKALAKKVITERMVPEARKEQLEKMPAAVQSKIYNNFAGYVEKRFEERHPQNKNEIKNPARKPAEKPAGELTGKPAGKPTDKRYVDILESDNYTSGLTKSVTPDLADEVKRLKDMIIEMKSEQAALGDTQRAEQSNPELYAEFCNLLRNGIEKKYAANIIKQVSFELNPADLKNEDKVFDTLATEIMNAVKTDNVLERIQQDRIRTKRETQAGSHALRPMQCHAFVGPTGVGKTTTIAKLASIAILNKNLRVGLINVDTYKVAALDQLATYAKILNAPFRQASNIVELDRAVSEFKTMDLILIDTTGRSQRDAESLAQMRSLLAQIPGISTQLIVSATHRDQELLDVIGRFKIFNPAGITFSKLDECSTYGCIYNVAVKTKLPLTFFTTGQQVPEDIEVASKERVAALILDL